MPLGRLGSLAGRGENQAISKFRMSLDQAMASMPTNNGVAEPASLNTMLHMVISRELTPGEALSCWKHYFRAGIPDEQFHGLQVLQQFISLDPHVASQLHAELASKRWRERFVILARTSEHPGVRPLLVTLLQTWASSYMSHDIGMHMTATIREIQMSAPAPMPGSGGGFGGTYSSQTTGYSAQPTGQGPYPQPGMPYAGVPPSYTGGYGAAGGYTGGYAASQSMMRTATARRSDTGNVQSKLDQLTTEVEALRGCIRALEGALGDYKAERAPFSVLSGALDRGARTADRCQALQSQLETLLGSSDNGDEGLMARVFSTNDSAVAVIAQWKAVANQDVAPEDVSGRPSASGGPSTSAGALASPGQAAAPAPLPPPPAPTPLDLLLGDELPAPVPAPQAAPFPGPSYPAAAAVPPSYPPPPAPGAAFGAAYAPVGAAANGPGAPAVAPVNVVPAADMDGLRAQVLALASELEQQRRAHATALETQQAFHRSELAQARARVTELEAEVGRLRQQPQQPGAAPLPLYAPPAPTASAFPPAQPAPPSYAPPTSNNPFATLTSLAPPPPPHTMPGLPMASAGAAPGAAQHKPMGMAVSIPSASAPAGTAASPGAAPPPTAASLDSHALMNAFDELALSSVRASGSGAAGAAGPTAFAAPAPAPAAAGGFSAMSAMSMPRMAAPPPASSLGGSDPLAIKPTYSASMAPPPGPTTPAPGAAAGNWVDF